jgi:hypothetical protein
MVPGPLKPNSRGVQVNRSRVSVVRLTPRLQALCAVRHGCTNRARIIFAGYRRPPAFPGIRPMKIHAALVRFSLEFKGFEAVPFETADNWAITYALGAS